MNNNSIIITTQNGNVRIFSTSAFSLSSEDWARSRQQKRMRIEEAREQAD